MHGDKSKSEKKKLNESQGETSQFTSRHRTNNRRTIMSLMSLDVALPLFPLPLSLCVALIGEVSQIAARGLGSASAPLADLPEISHNYSDSCRLLTSLPALPWKRLPSRRGGRIGVKGICISHRPYLIKNPSIANKERGGGRAGGLFNFHTLLALEGLSHPGERYRVAARGSNGCRGGKPYLHSG